MKKIIFLTLLFLSIAGFNQADTCSNYGSILGWDSTRCGCCEGWIIELNGKRYLADSIPNAKEFFKSERTKRFPILVFLNYEPSGGCANKIVITCIKVR